MIPDAGGKFRHYHTSGALLGICQQGSGGQTLPPQGARWETTMRGV